MWPSIAMDNGADERVDASLSSLAQSLMLLMTPSLSVTLACGDLWQWTIVLTRKWTMIVVDVDGNGVQ